MILSLYSKMVFTHDWKGLLSIDSTTVLGAFAIKSLVMGTTILATLLVNDVAKGTPITLEQLFLGVVVSFSASMLGFLLAHIFFGYTIGKEFDK